MALPLLTICIVEVAKPNIGEKQPSRVRADITVNLSVKDDIKNEWEGLRRHDVVFLVTVRPPIASNDNRGIYDFDGDFVPQVKWWSNNGLE
jgi:intron-binding protein aquarius